MEMVFAGSTLRINSGYYQRVLRDSGSWREQMNGESAEHAPIRRVIIDRREQMFFI